MLKSLWSRLTGVPDLLDALNRLRYDAERCFKQPGIQAAWKRFQNDPAIRGVWPRLAEEWRSVEEAINRLKQ